jgi:hypothetical protein
MMHSGVEKYCLHFTDFEKLYLKLNIYIKNALMCTLVEFCLLVPFALDLRIPTTV